MSEIYEGAIDRGLEGVVACSTGISSIVDATLCYRGFTIEDLAENATFEEIIYLLWNDIQPNEEQLKTYNQKIKENLFLDPKLMEVLKLIPTNVHPMSWLRSAVSLLAHWDSMESDIDAKAQTEVGFKLVAKLPLLVSFYENLRNGTLNEMPKPKPEKGIAWNFLYTLNRKEPSEMATKVFDTCLVLHADHELNCSAFSSRVTASSLSDIYSAVVSGIGALKGPLHGGANEQVMRMLVEIGNVDGAKKWVKAALEKKELVMGFGHRVYKNGDPRAKVLRQMSKALCKEAGMSQYYDMSEVIDETVKAEKGLLPNVDFYSATVYYSMGIPIDLYTPIFAVSRVSGWLAHIYEQYSNNRIYRPRGKWVGKANQKWK
jgi:citrate synthase